MVGSGKDVGVVREGELYTLVEVRRRLGVSQAGLRVMRRSGLRVARFGKRGYVLGRDVIAFIEGVVNGCDSQGR